MSGQGEVDCDVRKAVGAVLLKLLNWWWCDDKSVMPRFDVCLLQQGGFLKTWRDWLNRARS